MGIAVSEYRAKINVFAGGKQGRHGIVTRNMCEQFLLFRSLMNNSLGIRLCLFSLLVIGNVEVNPGPLQTRSASVVESEAVTKKDVDIIIAKLDDIAKDSKEIKERFSHLESRINNIEDTLHEMQVDTIVHKNKYI